MDDQLQLDLTSEPSLAAPIKQLLLEILGLGRQPSAWEIVEGIEHNFGPKAPLEIQDVLKELSEDRAITTALREFAESLLASDDLIEALRGDEAPKREVSTHYYGKARPIARLMISKNWSASWGSSVTTLRSTTCSSVSRTRRVDSMQLNVTGVLGLIGRLLKSGQC